MTKKACDTCLISHRHNFNAPFLLKLNLTHHKDRRRVLGYTLKVPPNVLDKCPTCNRKTTYSPEVTKYLFSVASYHYLQDMKNTRPHILGQEYEALQKYILKMNGFPRSLAIPSFPGLLKLIKESVKTNFISLKRKENNFKL